VDTKSSWNNVDLPSESAHQSESSKINKRPAEDRLTDQRPAKKSSTLHASWEAAQLRREKEASMMFLPGCGRRTVFEEVERDQSIPKVTVRAIAPSVEKSIPFAGSSSTVQDHPSWIAKQALRAKLNSGFQGTKKTFV
jgi:hypothetical protein